jgi:hypothetical protein
VTLKTMLRGRTLLPCGSSCGVSWDLQYDSRNPVALSIRSAAGVAVHNFADDTGFSLELLGSLNMSGIGRRWLFDHFISRHVPTRFVAPARGAGQGAGRLVTVTEQHFKYLFDGLKVLNNQQ